MFRGFFTFSRILLFFLEILVFLLSDLLSSSFLFSDSSHLAASSVHIVGSLTSNLPSAMSLHQIIESEQAGSFCQERGYLTSYKNPSEKTKVRPPRYGDVTN